MSSKRESFSGWIRSVFEKLESIFRKMGKILTPDTVAWKSASIGIIVVVLILLLIFAFLYMGKLGVLISGLSVFYFLITGIVAALGLFLILKILRIIPNPYKWILTGATVILLFFWPGTLKGKLLIIAVTILSASFIAGSAGMILKKG